jgi:Ni,Fe-hydrogenase I cytochrome b subunit
MENTQFTKENSERPPRIIMVWDLPTRLFHWLLVIFVIISFVTGNIGGNAMQHHEWSGFMILTLLLFRLVWGFVGSRESRFMTFIRGPSAVISYARILLRRRSVHYLGHNPLGGWSIIALLLTLQGHQRLDYPDPQIESTGDHRTRMCPRPGGALLLFLQARKSGSADDHRW